LAVGRGDGAPSADPVPRSTVIPLRSVVVQCVVAGHGADGERKGTLRRRRAASRMSAGLSAVDAVGTVDDVSGVRSTAAVAVNCSATHEAFNLRKPWATASPLARAV
jgi:hypothetical protein